MGERVSFNDNEGESTGDQPPAARWSGAALGVGGTLLTLLIGGFFTTMIPTLLGIGPHGPVMTKYLNEYLHLNLLRFACGIWLTIPAAFAGYRMGFDRTLEWFSHFWCTADRPQRKLSLALWAGLGAVCAVSTLLAGALL